MFSSSIHRIRLAVELAHQQWTQGCIVGRSMNNPPKSRRLSAI